MCSRDSPWPQVALKMHMPEDGIASQLASAASKVCTKTVPTSLRTHSSKRVVRKLPNCSAPTERSETVVPSWYRVRPLSLMRSTTGMNCIQVAAASSRRKR